MRRLLITLVVIAGVLAGLDRLAAFLASQQVATETARAVPECRRPGVDIHGFPFLTQAIAGRYDHVTLTTACRSPVDLRQVRVQVYGARLGLGQIVHENVDRIPVNRATGRLTIPFAALNQRFGAQRLTFRHGPRGTVTVTGTLSVAGQTVSAHGAASVSFSDGALHITVGSVGTPAGSIDTGGAFDVSLPLPQLPFHLTGARVEASAAGVVIEATARHIVLQR